jgi:hypothetical protein
MVIAATGFPSLKPILSLTQFISASTLSCKKYMVQLKLHILYCPVTSLNDFKHTEMNILTYMLLLKKGCSRLCKAPIFLASWRSAMRCLEKSPD